MTTNCKQCRYWTGQKFDDKPTWRRCENPKAKQYKMYMEWGNHICKRGKPKEEKR